MRKLLIVTSIILFYFVLSVQIDTRTTSIADTKHSLTTAIFAQDGSNGNKGGKGNGNGHGHGNGNGHGHGRGNDARGVPEPGLMLLLGSSLAGYGIYRRIQNKKK